MELVVDIGSVKVWHADARVAAGQLPDDSVDAIVTSPPYFGLRDYGVEGQLGLEEDPESYVEHLADTLTSYASVLKDTGSLWLNMGDSYSSGGRGYYDTEGGKTAGAVGRFRPRSDFPGKSLLMVPERTALALIQRGWILRNKVVWAKPNGMPESVKDRCSTKWEYVFHLVRQERYYYDLDAIREPHAEVSIRRAERNRDTSSDAEAYFGNPPSFDPAKLSPGGKNPGDVWTVNTQPYPEAHFAVYPPQLVERPILATVPEGGVVLDPFFGAGTTGLVAHRLGRRAWGIELNRDYCFHVVERIEDERTSITDAEGVGPAVATALAERGYREPGDLMEVSDEDLLAVPGIGPTLLASLRGFVEGCPERDHWPVRNRVAGLTQVT